MHRRLTAASFAAVFGFSSLVIAGEPLPYYDIRLDAVGLPRPFVQEALAAQRSTALPQRALARNALLANIPGLRIDDHEFFGTPNFIRSTSRFLTAPVAGKPVAPRSVVRDFVALNQPLFEIDPVELDKARTSRDFITDHNGVTHLTFQQQICGIDLHGCEVLANVACDGALINIGSTMLPRPADDFQPAQPLMTALDAIKAAAAHIDAPITVDPTPLTDPTGITRKQTWSKTPDFRADETITTELIYFPRTRTDIRPAWSLLLPEIGIGNTYEMMVDATTGEVLRRWNRLHFATTEPATYRVYTSDGVAPGTPGTTTPDGTQFPAVLQQLVTINPGDISAINPNGWIDDGVNETLGNNVDAHLDRDGTANSPDLPRPAGTPYRTFDFTHDPAQAPTVVVNQSAAVVQMFYLCNRYHDRLHAMGFNEAAKNFQLDNFGRGGSGNDRVQADGQDGSGTNNANFSTSGSDGSTGRCQMYIFTGPTPDRDGDLDAEIVYHELSHGLSIRLSNGTVNGTQSGGMGEGWGDFFGSCLNAESTDDPHAVYSTGAYTTLQLGSAAYTTNYYFGIRRFPYSTDMNKNPQTYADIDAAQMSFPGGVPISPLVGVVLSASATEIHNVGEVWCNALLECRANLWDVHGFAANQTMMQLVVDGLKLQPSNPNFLQARDAILQADMVNNASANLGYLWQAFAKRGMGANATSPSGSTSSGLVESFVVPPLVQFDYPDGTPSLLTPSQPTAFRVNVASLAGQSLVFTPNSGQLHYSTNGAAFAAVAMTEVTADHYLATLPAMNCMDSVRYYVSVGTSVGTANDPGNAPTTFRQASAYSSVTTIFTDDAEIDRGWTIGVVGDTATLGQWTRGDPLGTAAQPDSAHGGANCFFTGQGTIGGTVGEADVDNGLTTLMSPLLDLTAGDGVTISYWRWFSNDAGATPNTETFRVDLSTNNGSTWTNMETLGAAFGGEHSGGWVFHQFSVPANLRTNLVRVRFVADDAIANAGSLVEAAIDDFNVAGFTCQVTCTHGDVNGDLAVDGQDVARFVQILLNGGGTPVENCSGDLAASPNGAIDAGDVPNFVSCILAGGC